MHSDARRDLKTARTKLARVRQVLENGDRQTRG
jgi:hypothetical protein